MSIAKRNLMHAYLLAALTLLSFGQLWAQDVTIATIDGSEQTGRLESFDGVDGFMLNGKKIPLDQVTELRFGRAIELPAKVAQIRLRQGGAVYGEIKAATDEMLQLESAVLGTLMVPIDGIQGVVLPVAVDEERVQAFFALTGLKEDQMLTPKGDTVPGFIEKVASNELKFDAGGQMRTLKFDEVAAFRYAALDKLEPLKGMIGKLSLTDGSTLSGILEGLNAGKLKVKLLAGQHWEVPLNALSTVVFSGGKLVYLSELKPEVEEQPFISGSPMLFKWRKDLSTLGKPMRLGNKTFTRGIGMHSLTRLTFELNADFGLFLAEVAMQEEAQGLASWQVLGDGKVLKEGIAQSGKEPVKLELDVKNVNKLTLVVDYGPDRDDAGDHVNFANARLVRK